MRYACLLLMVMTLGVRAERVIQFGDSPPRNEGVEVMEREDASNGLAYFKPKGKSGGIRFGYSWETMGIYEATFRLMTDDNTVTDEVISISYTCETTRFPNPPKEVRTSLKLTGTDFAAANTWQDFTLIWVSPNTARNGYQVHSAGTAGVAIDCITTRQVRPITEPEMLSYLNIKEPPAPTQLPIGPRRIHLMQGVFADYWLADWAVARLGGARVDRSDWATGGVGREQPATPEALYKYDAVIMVGTDIQHIPLAMRPAYTKWVEAGGCLVILGGPYGFGQSGIDLSSLAELLPVRLSGRFDLHRETHPLLAGPGATAEVKQILADGAGTPVTFFRHDLTVKPESTIWLGTPEAPLLISGTVGKGTVIAACFAPMGEASNATEGQVAFWNDPRFSRVLATVLKQSMAKRETTPWHLWKPPAAPTPEAKPVVDAASGGMDALEADLLGDGESSGSQALTPEQLQTLIRGGGRPAVPILLKAMATLTDPAQIRAAEYAVRPYMSKEDASLVQALVDSPHTMVRESGVALLGLSHPKTPPKDFAGRLQNGETRMQRSAIRSAREGGYRIYLDTIKKLQAKLKEQVIDKRDALYEGYWYGGFQKQDPIWPYTEATLTLVAAGEPGYLNDLTDLYLLLHLHHLRMRSFIYLYNDKVPREAEAKKQHILRNQFLHPELHDALDQVRQVLSQLSPEQQTEFRQQVLATQDLELLRLLLYPTYDLAGSAPGAEWTDFLHKLDDHVMQAAKSSDRL